MPILYAELCNVSWFKRGIGFCFDVHKYELIQDFCMLFKCHILSDINVFLFLYQSITIKWHVVYIFVTLGHIESMSATYQPTDCRFWTSQKF